MVLRTFSKAYGPGFGSYAGSPLRCADRGRPRHQAAGHPAYDEPEVRVSTASGTGVADPWQLDLVWFPPGARLSRVRAACEAVGLMVR